MEVSDNPHRITAKQIQELVVKFTKETFDRRVDCIEVKSICEITDMIIDIYASIK